MKRIFKRNVYLLLGLTALCSGIIGCDDRMDDPVSGQELVTVPLSFGFAEESISELYRNGSPQRLALKAVTPPSTRACCPMCKPVPRPMFRIIFTIWKSVNMTLPAII
ncbi:hypothetical protein [Bacteroides cellulosilyticus]|uniref:hypothetical protein n=1 Tax=Bacteroides cellulosilyticus TaxID=246787 RepID=UPI0032EEE330